MTNDTQDQRLTYEQAHEATRAARERYDEANWEVSADEHIAFVHGYIEGAAVRCPGEGPTDNGLRAAIERLPELTEGARREGTARWSEAERDAYSLAIEEAQAALRAVLAEHAPTEGPPGV